MALQHIFIIIISINFMSSIFSSCWIAFIIIISFVLLSKASREHWRESNRFIRFPLSRYYAIRNRKKFYNTPSSYLGFSEILSFPIFVFFSLCCFSSFSRQKTVMKGESISEVTSKEKYEKDYKVPSWQVGFHLLWKKIPIFLQYEEFLYIIMM